MDFNPMEQVVIYVQDEIALEFPGYQIEQVAPNTEVASINMGQERKGRWPFYRFEDKIGRVLLDPWETASIDVMNEIEEHVAIIEYEVYLGYDEDLHIGAWWVKILDVKLTEGAE